jgi:hypothetical protein
LSIAVLGCCQLEKVSTVLVLGFVTQSKRRSFYGEQ